MLGLIPLIIESTLKGLPNGEIAYIDVCQRVGFEPDQKFRLDTNYDDKKVLSMIDAAADVLGIARSEVLSAFADTFIAEANRRFPKFFEMSRDSRDFLERQPAIHACLSSGVEGLETREAVKSKFEVEKISGGIITHYKSPNCLGALYVALAERVIKHYSDTATITPLDDINASECRIQIVWDSEVA